MPAPRPSPPLHRSAAFKRHRCLIPSTGYYEWKKLEDGTKQPYLFTMKDGQPFSFADLWERWEKGPEPIETCTIITGQPNPLEAEIHNRMPVILDPADYDTWLRAGDTAIAEALLQPFPSQLMHCFPLSKRQHRPGQPVHQPRVTALPRASLDGE